MEMQNEKIENNVGKVIGAPSKAFILASFAAMGIGIATYLLGLWNSTMDVNIKGYYFIVLFFGLFSAISVQKTVRDREEGIPTTTTYFLISCVSLALSIILLTLALYNNKILLRSEKGFYLMSYVLCLYSSVVVQKNIRDVLISK